MPSEVAYCCYEIKEGLRPIHVSPDSGITRPKAANIWTTENLFASNSILDSVGS